MLYVVHDGIQVEKRHAVLWVKILKLGCEKCVTVNGYEKKKKINKTDGDCC